MHTMAHRIAVRYIAASYEKRITRFLQEAGLDDLTVAGKHSRRGATIKIIRGRKEVGYVTTADLFDAASMRDHFMEMAAVGLPVPTRGGRPIRASYDKDACMADLRILSKRVGKDMGLWYVGGSWLNELLRGIGLGRLLYYEMAKIAAMYGNALAPDVCADEKTSPAAFRVWDSLRRDLPNEGYVFWGFQASL